MNFISRWIKISFLFRNFAINSELLFCRVLFCEQRNEKKKNICVVLSEELHSHASWNSPLHGRYVVSSFLNLIVYDADNFPVEQLYKNEYIKSRTSVESSSLFSKNWIPHHLLLGETAGSEYIMYMGLAGKMGLSNNFCVSCHTKWTNLWSNDL